MGPMIVRSLRKETKLPFDVHLMIENPDFFLKSFADAGSDIIVVSVETGLHLNRTIQTIKKLGKKAGVALNPATPLCMIENVLEDVDMILIMCVNPGFYGQAFIPSVLPKIENCRKMIKEQGLDIDIEVDGGINEKTAPLVVKAGANVLVAGSAIYSKKDAKEAIQALRKSGSSFVQ
jgi:ribulose-phosphate 3-epimerase